MLGENLSNNEPNNTTEWDALSEVKMAETTPTQTEILTETTEITAETPTENAPVQTAEPLPENTAQPTVAEAPQVPDISAIDTEANRLKGATYAVKTLETAVSRWQDRLNQVQSGGFFKRLANRREIKEIKHNIEQRQKELDGARKSLAELTARNEQLQAAPQNQAPQTPQAPQIPQTPQTPPTPVEPPLEKAA